MLGLAVALWLVISVVPGLAVLRILRVPVSFVAAAVLAPPISFGLVYLLGLLATRAGASTQTLCFIALGLLVAVWLAVETGRLRADRAGSAERGVTGHVAPEVTRRQVWRETWERTRRLRPVDPQLALARGLLAVAVVGGVAMWSLVQSRLLVPAGWDAMHHGYFVRQIVEHHTLRPQVVLSSDPSRADGTTGFYPLAANLAAALINVASGLRISTILLASTMALAGVLLPAGVYVATRRLAPDLPVVSGLAAIAVVLPARLYTIDYTGRITIILGMALVPATVALLLLWGRHVDWRLAVLAPLAATGVIGVHTSELPIAALVAVAIALFWAVGDRAWRRTAMWFAYMLATAALTVIVLYLIDPNVIHLVSERSAAFGPANGFRLPFGMAVRRTVFLYAAFPAHNSVPMGLWSLTALIGCALTVHPRMRSVRGFALSYVAWALFFFMWMVGHLGPFSKFADLWYRDTQRMLWEFTALGAVPVGVTLYALAVGIHAAIHRVQAHSPRAVERRRGYSLGGVAVAALVVTVVLAFLTPPALTDARWLRSTASPVSRDSERAFAFLAAHVGPNDRVLDDLENHGDLWLYVDDRVATVFGNPPLIGGATVSWKDRLYLRGRLKHIGTDPCVSRLIHAYGVEYIFYSTARMWGGKPKITLTALRDTKYFRQVFHAGGARVFQVVAPDPQPSACTRDTAVQYPWSTLANSN